MEYTIQKLGKLAGVSTRTLRYYDEIGLLCPCRIQENGYRIYGGKEVDRLQQILFYRTMGLELSKIASALNEPDFNKVAALKHHLTKLNEKQKQLNKLIHNVKQTILKEEGKINMTDYEKFKGFKENLVKENEDNYGKEIRKKYGSSQIDESNEKIMNLTKEQYEKMENIETELINRLENAVKNQLDPTKKEGQAIASLHQEWLSYTWNSYSKEAHLGLAELYIQDERFTAYYDKNISGCAKFLRDAIFSCHS